MDQVGIAKGFARALLIAGFVLMSSCSKQKNTDPSVSQTPTVETFPISTGELRGCHFQNRTVIYSFGGTIAPNPIVCDQGVATSVQLLSPTPLPTGLQFNLGQLSLTGSANQKIAATSYQFYVENESGYLILPITITVQ